MTFHRLATAADWEAIRLVAFDVDGTLYRQRRLRWRMAAELARDALVRRDLTTLRVLARYRRLRDQLADAETEDFLPPLLAATAAASGVPESKVTAIVEEWIERRPLPHLAALRHPGLGALFAALRRRGKKIGVLSDYPAVAKLAALGLAADHVVSAEDAAIGVMKPEPRGLIALMHAAGAEPATTVLVGDRVERDGMAARRAGARALIRSARPVEGWQTFTRYDGPPFTCLLGG